MFICKGEVMKMNIKDYECEVVEVHEDKINELQKDMLPQETFNDVSALFKMFADPSRLKILSLLFKEELCVCDISCLLDMSQSAVSHQLSVLRSNRIIKFRKVGKNVYYTLDDQHIQMIYNAGLEHVMEGVR